MVSLLLAKRHAYDGHDQAVRWKDSVLGTSVSMAVGGTSRELSNFNGTLPV